MTDYVCADCGRPIEFPRGTCAGHDLDEVRRRARAPLVEALEEIAKNCEGAVAGGLPHFTRDDIANAAAFRARAAIRKAESP